MSFFRYDNSVNSPLGFAIEGASIAVLTQPAVTTNQPGTPLATIYAASASNAATVTAASFANGYINFTLNTVPADVVVGSYISVVSASPAGYNGIWQVVSVAGSVVGVETPYQTSAPNPGTWVSGGTVATSALPNPFLTDNIGNYFFYAASDLYTVQEYDTLNRIIPKVYLDQDVGFTAGGGSVISVAQTGDGVIFDTTVDGSPITTSGTLVPALLNQSANRILAGPPSGGVATPTFRALVAADLPSSGVGSGTVTSVAATIATDSFVASSITGSPITASGTLAINVNFSSQAANFFLCGPATGGSAAPTFRAIVPSDLPPSLAFGNYVSVKNFGAIGNAKHTWCLTSTATSANISLVADAGFGGWFDNTTFTQADVGATILIYGAGTTNLTFKSTIASVTDATHAVCADVVPNSTSDAEAVWGLNDDGPAIQAAINATSAAATVVLIPPGTYLSSVGFSNAAAPFCYGVIGLGSLGTNVAMTNITSNVEGFTIADAPFGFQLVGWTLFGQGQLASSLTDANGIHFETIVQVPKERIFYSDMRVSQFPQTGLLVECSIVSSFQNFTCDNCGTCGINFAPAETFAGTSTTVNNGYANNCGTDGWLLNGLFYSTFNSCASDSHVTAYNLNSNTGLTFNACGNEGTTGNPWELDTITSVVINSPYIEIDQAVTSGQVMFNFDGGSADVQLNVPFCVINGDVTNGILIASDCAYITITHPIINNFSFTSAGPVTDMGYANLLIFDEFEDGLTFKTNDNQTFYNLAIAGNDVNMKNFYCGIITPNFAPPVASGDVTFSGWGGAATLNYTEGFSTAYGVGINCLGTANPVTTVAAASVIQPIISQCTNFGLYNRYTVTSSPIPPVGQEIFITSFSNAGNNGSFIVIYADASQVLVEAPAGVTEAGTGITAYSWATTTYTGTFASPPAYGSKVLTGGGAMGVDNVGEWTVISCNSTTLVVNNGAGTVQSGLTSFAWVDDQTANPTVTITYETPFLVPPTPVVSSFQSDDETKQFVITSSDENSITFTLLGTPVNGDSYALFAHTFASY